jgi:excisionase family DNA binding protein
MENKTDERAALLNLIQSARLLGVSPASMRRVIAAGSLEPVRIAGLGHPRFRRSDVEALVREGRAP